MTPPAVVGRHTLRVLTVIDSLAPAGAERSLLATAPRLRELGVDLQVAYLRRAEASLHDQFVAASVPLHPLHPLDAGSSRRSGLLATRRLVANLSPDLVHTTLFEADLAGRLAGLLTRTPVVSSLVNVAYGPEQARGAGIRRSRLLLAQAADAATAQSVRRFHALTEHVATVMSHRLVVPRSRIDVIPRGRDPEALGRRSPARSAEVRRRLGVEPATPLVVVASRQERQKGLDVLLHATRLASTSVPELRVVVAGREGGATRQLHDAQHALGLDATVRFLGPRTDVPDLLAAADVFALPSRWEGFGSVLVEAMALEAPIVASGLPAVREVLDESCALLVPPEDPESLAAVLLAGLTDQDRARERAAVARQRFEERYTIDRVAEGTVAFYHRASS